METELMASSASLTRSDFDDRRTRIHVGCGPKSIKETWWNIDVREFKGVDQVCDITLPWVGIDNVQYVYGEHFLEHLTLRQAFSFLQHAGEAMAEGGTIRLSTPSLEWVSLTHFDAHSAEPNDLILQTLRFNRAFHGWGHKFLWSQPVLKRALESTGFGDVVFCAYGESSDPALRGLEQHGGYAVVEGFPSVWIVEAKRRRLIEIDAEFIELAHSQFSVHVEAGH